MYYSVRHMTIFHYSQPVSEKMMELRMQPRGDGTQRCLRFDAAISPRARLNQYLDSFGNAVHYFDLHRDHERLTIIAEAIIEMKPSAPLPERLPLESWRQLDEQAYSAELYDFLLPSQYPQPTPLLAQLAAELDVTRRDDPLTVLRRLNSAMYAGFDYVQHSTRVDSPIDDALRSRQGVCQDFSHIMIALLRGLGIPSRYVSGYLFHRKENDDRSDVDSTHAWIEAWLPGLDWVGFDPTNNVLCGERHIRVGLGRDYADVPPTKGIFKGKAETVLEVRVDVRELEELPVELLPLHTLQVPPDEYSDTSQQQQQQQ